MLEQGDIDLNSVYNFRDSSKIKIKQTILNQELVFRRQVFDLHKLCRVQRSLMEDLKQKGLLRNYNLHNLGTIPVSVNLNNEFKSLMSEVSQPENINLHYDLLQQPVLMQKPIDLQLSADEFISQCVDSEKSVATSSKESIVSMHSCLEKVFIDLDPPNRSLIIERGAKMKGKEHRSWKGKAISSSSTNIIVLENANTSFSNHEAYLNSSSPAPKSCSENKHKLDSFLMSGQQKLKSFAQSGIRDGSSGAILIKSPVYADASCRDPGFNGHCRKLLPSSENQESSICKVNNFDLNTVPFEDPSCFSNNNSVVEHSTITSSSPALEKVCHKSSVIPASWREADVNQMMDFHDTHQQKEVNLAEEGDKSGKAGEFREGSRANINYVNLDSDSSGELRSCRTDQKISSVVSSSKISNDLSYEVSVIDTVGEKVIIEKGAEPFEQPNCWKLSSSSESECMDHQSSSIKTIQSGVGCDDINISSSIEREKVSIDTLATHSGEQDLSFDSTESNIQCNIKKEAEFDATLQTAAEVIVQMSMVTGALCEDDLEKTPVKKVHNENNDQPQCSLDSYEAMVLNVEESSPDEYFSSSNAFLVDVSETKDVKYKLKRGTRMKDFQKDILPCLSTLSRQEIREDINILESTMRSREYKRMREKNADSAGDWCRSTRSKRSKANRRYYA